MAIVGVYAIALTFLGMSFQLFRLAQTPTSIDAALRSGNVAVSERAITRLRTRRIAARFVGLLMFVSGAGLAYAGTATWL